MWSDPGKNKTYKDDVLRVEQAFDGIVHVRLGDRALDLVLRLSRWGTDATEEDICQSPVHSDALTPSMNTPH